MTTHPGGKDKFLADHPIFRGVKSFTPEMQMGFKMSLGSMVDVIGMLAKEYIGEEISDKIKAVRPHVFVHTNDGWLKPHGNFTTICHGDSWANNAMYRQVASKLFSFSFSLIGGF